MSHTQSRSRTIPLSQQRFIPEVPPDELQRRLDAHFEEIRICGRDTLVRAENVCGRTTIVTGAYVRTAQVMDEELVEGAVIPDPDSFIRALTQCSLRADLFVFSERPPQTTARYPYHVEWDNWAVIPTGSYETWWSQRLPRQSRQNVRCSERRGVVVRSSRFDEAFVRGIQKIYDETPVRQDRRFWHYRKDFDAVKRVNVTYEDRSEFIGAYYEDELIGFAKVVFTDDVGTLMQLLSMKAHSDKRPTNALIAHAVKACVARNCTYLVYGQYTYGEKKDDSLTEFKRRNGFERLDFPRYYVPLTLRGRLAIKLGLHLGVKNLVPEWATSVLRRARARSLRIWTRAVLRR